MDGSRGKESGIMRRARKRDSGRRHARRIADATARSEIARFSRFRDRVHGVALLRESLPYVFHVQALAKSLAIRACRFGQI